MKDTLFTVGPVEMYPEILEIGANQLPYFRTDDFSIINSRIDENMKKCMFTDQSSKTALLTASGTAAMEAAVISIFSQKDKILIIVGGGFGRRFVEICETYHFQYVILELLQGQTLTCEDLEPYKNQDITGILINIHETSTGVLFDGKLIGEFSKKIGATLVVDAISSFLADEYKMDEWGIDATIISSQKALALPPGMAAVVVNYRTFEKIKNNKSYGYYLDLNTYFVDMERGQTPYTTAVGITLQMDARLLEICKLGVENTILQTEKLAQDFRNKIRKLPFEIPSQRLSNAVTPLKPQNGVSAYDIFQNLKKEYHFIVCPSGGKMKESLIRIGHLGNLKIEHNNTLIEALEDMKKRGLL
jgi:Serine-pyruvate aminotransferase/archaeal aspartate aminotransferase